MSIPLESHLNRLSAFSANLCDAFSAFIFLPSDILSVVAPHLTLESRGETLIVVGHHSLSQELDLEIQLEPGHSLIGWVAKHNQQIQVSPFDRDSRTLGVYLREEEIKSFLALPIPLSVAEFGKKGKAGVLMVDSRKPYAFSKHQAKLLDDVCVEIGALLATKAQVTRLEAQNSSWNQFIAQGTLLVNTLGPHAVDVLRIRMTNISELEISHGSRETTDIVQQLLRLIQQTIPPHFPLTRGPQGDIVLLVDNMMTSFFENKIAALCDHLHTKGVTVAYEFFHQGVTKQTLHYTLEELVASTALMKQSFEEAHVKRSSRY